MQYCITVVTVVTVRLQHDEIDSVTVSVISGMGLYKIIQYYMHVFY